MKPEWLIAAIALATLAATWHLRRGKGKGSQHQRPRKREPLTKREQPMFFRLREAFPDDVVLAQVAFSALITSTRRATRNTFDRKVADFVLCTRAFQVKAVIELDDSTHRDRETQDAARDALLTNAGYRVIRFPNVPDVDTLRRAVNGEPLTDGRPSEGARTSSRSQEHEDRTPWGRPEAKPQPENGKTSQCFPPQQRPSGAK